MSINLKFAAKVLSAFLGTAAAVLCVVLAVHAHSAAATVNAQETEPVSVTEICTTSVSPAETATQLPEETTAPAATMPETQTTNRAVAKTTVQPESKPAAPQVQVQLVQQVVPAQTTAPAMPHAAPKTETTQPAPAVKKYSVFTWPGEGVYSVSGDGSFAPGTKVTVRCKTNENFRNAFWTSSNSAVSGGRGESYTFIMPASNVVLTAGAEQYLYRLSLTSGSGVYGLNGAGNYRPGDRVHVSCAVQNGYVFRKWSSNVRGVSDSTSGSYTFIMPAANLTLSASAERTQYTVTLEKGTGIASVTGAGVYTAGSTVVVSCTTFDGFSFEGWKSSDTSRTPSSNSQTYSFVMPSANIKLSAKSIQNQYTLKLQGDDGILSVSGAGSYAPGTTVTVRCSVRSGYTFQEWKSGNLPGSTSKTYTFTMPQADVTLHAVTQEKVTQTEPSAEPTSGTPIPMPTHVDEGMRMSIQRPASSFLAEEPDPEPTTAPSTEG